MSVYLKKRADAARLLIGEYTNLNGDSAFTRLFELRRGPMRYSGEH